LKNPQLYKSVSAFAPISAPSQCPWGVKAFSGYLGDDRETWKQYDASELVASASARFEAGILIDQGLADNFLAAQLHPEIFEAAAQQAGQSVTVRRHEGYDHGYYFISTFIGEHIAHHARVLCA
jgi:S-formylglutathione hydrolase